MLSCCEVLEEDVVLGTDSKLLTKPNHVVEDVVAHKGGLPIRWLEKTCKHRYRCGFACTVVAQKCKDLATVHGE